MSWSIEKHFKLKATRNIIIVGGTHGAGKSTLCKELKSHLKWEYLSPQRIEGKLNESASKGAIYKLLLKAVREKISSGESFIYEHIMSGNFIEKLIQESQAEGFKCHLMFLDIESAELAFKRVQKRVEDGGHGVALNHISKKLKESRFNFWLKYKDHCSSWLLLDSSSEKRRVISRFDMEFGLNVILEKEHFAFTRKVNN